MEKCNVDLKMKPPVPNGPGEPHYPSVFLDLDPEVELPKSGQLLITYRLQSESTHVSDGEDSRRSVTLEVLSIDGVEGETTAKKATASDDFETRMKAHRAKKMDSVGGMEKPDDVIDMDEEG